ncbi:MAG: YjbQ family protein [Magnetococcales bacterium]|nr:YjbQ family protein [Magnetococcales bacterium]NGZ06660.1 YjbQ family protein [Magnetococcales bacterium]
MRQSHTTFTVRTRGQGFYEITSDVVRWLQAEGVSLGQVTLFCRHTSAGLTIQENADPDVLRDLAEFLKRLVPEGASWYRHVDEGPDDMPAHIRATLSGVSLAIPVVQGRLVLGTWQGIFLCEHRQMPHTRQVVGYLIGEG